MEISECTKGLQTRYKKNGCLKGYELNSDKTACVETEKCTLSDCVDKVSTKPNNSHFITESCTDCSGTKTIKMEWTCDSGYMESGSSCICAPTNSCSGYTLTSQSGCSYGYEECDDGCGTKKYKCKACSPMNTCSGYILASQSGCSYGYEECDDGCGTKKYKCSDNGYGGGGGGGDGIVLPDDWYNCGRLCENHKGMNIRTEDTFMDGSLCDCSRY